jgi:hypothetical protein
MGGGSLADVPRLPADLAAVVPALRPIEGVATPEDHWVLGDPGRDYLIYGERLGDRISLELPAGKYRLTWIDPDSGGSEMGGLLQGGQRLEVAVKAKLLAIHAIN